MTPQQLRNSILQMAIEGKLVEQRLEDGASKDRLQVILKKSKPIYKVASSQEDDDVLYIKQPFILPSNWCWVRLGDICNIARGGSPRPIKDYITDSLEGVNWIKISDTTKGDKYISNVKEKIKREGIIKSRLVHPGDFLLTNSMSFGRPYILEVEGCIHDGWLVISEYEKLFNKDFLYWLLSSRFAYEQFCSQVSGAVVKNLNIEKVKNSIFPLPPLSEQMRILNKIEKILPLIDIYEEKWKELKKLNQNFPDALQKSILQEAIQGKLCGQKANDGSAQELIEKILLEKERLIEIGQIKKQKDLPPIQEEEIPFDIPENWCWERLKNIVYNRGQKRPDTEFSYIDIGSIDNINQKLTHFKKYINTEDIPSRARRIVDLGDILYSTVRPYLHNMCIVDRVDPCETIASTGFAVMTCHQGILNKYLFYYLLSPSFDKYANSAENSKGVAYPAINDKQLYKAVVPIPSLNEQKRIAIKIEEVFEKIAKYRLLLLKDNI